MYNRKIQLLKCRGFLCTKTKEVNWYKITWNWHSDTSVGDFVKYIGLCILRGVLINASDDILVDCRYVGYSRQLRSIGQQSTDTLPMDHQQIANILPTLGLRNGQSTLCKDAK